MLETVAQPNEWQRKVRAAAHADRGRGAKATQYTEFWTRYLERVHAEHPSWTNARVPQPVNWMSQPSGLRGTSITPSFAAGGRLRHELYVDCGDAERNADLFNALREHRADIEASYGRPLEFEELPTRKASKVGEYSVGDVGSPTEHDSYIDWFFDYGERLRRAVDAVADRLIY